jgi:predicted PurR-regulated permease PerM
MSRVEIPQIPPGQIIRWTVGVALVIVGFWLLFRFSNVVLLAAAAVMLSAALRPGVEYLARRGIPRPAGVLLILLVVVALLAGLIALSVPLLAQQGAAIQSTLAEGYQSLRQGLEQLPNLLVTRLLQILPESLPGMMEEADGASIGAELDMEATAAQASRLLLGLFYVLALGVMTFFWLLEGEYLKRAAFLLAPPSRRGEVQELVREIESKVSSYLLGQGLLCLVIGVLAFAAYLLIGLPHALLLAVFAGLLEAVPVVGPILGAVPAVIVALSISPAAAVWVLVATLVIQQVEGSVLVPRVMRRTIGVRPLVTLLALLTFSSLFGLLGAIIALPLAAIIQMLLDRTLLKGDVSGGPALGRDRLSLLRYETQQLIGDVRSAIRHKEGEPSLQSDVLEDELEALALDLESYLAGRGAAAPGTTAPGAAA